MSGTRRDAPHTPLSAEGSVRSVSTVGGGGSGMRSGYGASAAARQHLQSQRAGSGWGRPSGMPGEGWLADLCSMQAAGGFPANSTTALLLHPLTDCCCCYVPVSLQKTPPTTTTTTGSSKRGYRPSTSRRTTSSRAGDGVVMDPFAPIKVSAAVRAIRKRQPDCQCVGHKVS